MTNSSAQELKKTAKHSAIYAIGTVVRRITGFVMLPIYTQYLTPADYGVVELLTMAIEIASILIGLRISQALFRYYILAKNNVEKQLTVSTVMTTIIVSSSIGSFVLYYFSENLSVLLFGADSYVNEFELFSFTLITNAVTAVGLSYVRVIQRPYFFITIGFLTLAFQVFLNVYFVVHLELHVTGVIYSSLISGVAISLFLMVYVYNSVGIKFSVEIFLKLIKFVSPLIVAALGSFYVSYADKYFLRLFVGLEAVGIYSLSLKVASVITIVYESFDMSWSADRLEIAKNRDKHHLYGQVFKYIVAVIMLLGGGLSIFSDSFFKVMSSEAFHTSAIYVPILVLAFIFRVFGMYSNIGIIFSEKTNFAAKASWLQAILATLLYVILIPEWGIFGAAIGLLISQLAWAMYIYRVSDPLLPLNINFKSTALLVLLSLATVFFGLMILQLINYGFIVETLIFVAHMMIIWLLPIWTDNEREFLRKAPKL